MLTSLDKKHIKHQSINTLTLEDTGQHLKASYYVKSSQLLKR